MKPKISSTIVLLWQRSRYSSITIYCDWSIHYLTTWLSSNVEVGPLIFKKLLFVKWNGEFQQGQCIYHLHYWAECGKVGLMSVATQGAAESAKITLMMSSTFLTEKNIFLLNRMSAIYAKSTACERVRQQGISHECSVQEQTIKRGLFDN